MLSHLEKRPSSPSPPAGRGDTVSSAGFGTITTLLVFATQEKKESGRAEAQARGTETSGSPRSSGPSSSALAGSSGRLKWDPSPKGLPTIPGLERQDHSPLCGGTHDGGYVGRLWHRGGHGQTVCCEKPRKAVSLQWVLPGPSIQSPPEAGKELRVPEACSSPTEGKVRLQGGPEFSGLPETHVQELHERTAIGEPHSPAPIAPTVIIKGPQGNSGK